MAKRKKIDFELRLRCQKGGNIVKSPDPASFQKLLHAVKERAAYYDNVTILENCLESISAEDLIRNHASWHREFYQDTVHPAKILRSKKRYDKQILPARLPEGSEFLQVPVRPGRPASSVKEEQPIMPQIFTRSSKFLQDPKNVGPGFINPRGGVLCSFQYRANICQYLGSEILR